MEKRSNVGTIFGPGASGREPPRVGDAADDEGLEAADEIAKRYSPSERAELAARLIDDQAARLPWSPPSFDLTDQDFTRLREILDVLVDATEIGDREVLERVAAATDLLRATPTGKGDLRLAYARWIERLASQRTSSLFSDQTLVDGLAKRFDPAFANLKPSDLREALERAKGDKGGAGNRGPDRAAADLAVAVPAVTCPR